MLSVPWIESDLSVGIKQNVKVKNHWCLYYKTNSKELLSSQLEIVYPGEMLKTVPVTLTSHGDWGTRPKSDIWSQSSMSLEVDI